MLTPQPFVIVGHRPAAGGPTKDLMAWASGSLTGVLVWVFVVAAMALF